MILIAPSVAYRHDAATTAIASSSFSEVNGASSSYEMVKWIDVFDSTGRTLVLGRGKANSEVAEKLYIPPGGTAGPVPFQIMKGERLSIKALDTSATAGIVVINGYR